MTRLLHRTRSNRTDPKLFSSLVYVCRYAGLLDASIAAHWEARAPDPRVRTSVLRTFYLRGEFQCTLDNSSAMSETLREVFTLDELHHKRPHTVGLFEAVNVRDVRVIQRGENFGFSLEASETI